MSASEPPPKVWEYESQAVEEARAERLATLESLAHKHLVGLDHRSRVDEAEHPADEILRVAGEVDADAIAVGTHGRTGLRHALMGSVAEGVIRHSRVLVLVVPAPQA